MQSIIGRIFQDYGLIVCGWSGKHDTRLRESLLGSEKHRYSTYWTYYSELNDEASRIVNHRDGVAFKTDGAAAFFTDLKERLQGLEKASSADPLSTDVARERVKRYLPREEQKIALADFVRETAQETQSKVHDESRFPIASSDVSESITVSDRVNEYNAAIRTLLTEIVTIGYWGVESVNSGIEPVVNAISTISPSTGPQKTPYYDELLQLRRYPATSLIYGAGTAAISSENWRLIDELLSKEYRTYAIPHRNGRTGTPMRLFHPLEITAAKGKGFSRESADNSVREGAKEGVENVGMEFFSSNADFKMSFKSFEIIFDLALLREMGPDSIRFIEPTYRGEAIDNTENLIMNQGRELFQDGSIGTDSEEAEMLFESLREKLW